MRANGKELLRKAVSPATCTEGHWLAQGVDLGAFAGQTVKLEVLNQPSGWAYDAAYWAGITLRSE